MYEEYFGLKRSPFKITPDTTLFFDGGHRGDILGALVYAVHRGEGIIKVVGEVGSGKTMLCRMLQLQLPDNVDIVYIANPSISPEDILYVIASELKFDVPSNASKHQVVSRLQHYLLDRHAENRQVVLFIEEAQGMPIETLEEIRLLSNLETDQHKLLQIILFGQPELDENLAQKSIRQLRERITHDFNLAPLGADEIHRYLNFRMREVGYTGPELITPKLERQMAHHSEGLLRRINILADKMLLAAFADGTHTLSSNHLKAAVRDSGFSRLHGVDRQAWSKWILLGVPLLLLLALAYAYLQMGLRWPTPGVQAKSPYSDVSSPQPEAIAPIDDILDPPPQPAEVVVSAKAEVVEPPQQPEPVEQKPVASPAVEEIQAAPEQEQKTETLARSKKIQQTEDKLDKVAENQPVEVLSSSQIEKTHNLWLENKIKLSKQWLKNADKQGVSIQVMMRSKSAALELAHYLQTEWPLELEKTYIYEVRMKNKSIYRIFYDEFPTMSMGHSKIKQLPESVRANSPYLHSIYRMQKALL